MSGQVDVQVVRCGDVNVRPDRCFILDVRTPAEFREVHIPGAVNIPLADLGRFTSELKAAAAGKEVLLVCRTGRRATAACEQLRAEGVAGCQVLERGIGAWIDAGLPVNRGRKALSIERQVRIVAGSLVALGTALGAFISPWFLLLSGVIGMGLVFAGVTDSCAMGMLLARMPWNRAPEALTCAAPSVAADSKEVSR
jgi:rhodanese-related sulfurtransferase